MAFNERIEIKGLRPAAYNPRQIDSETLEALRRSVQTLGFVKPIVCRPDGLLIAGHQRVKASESLGMDYVPGHVVDVRGIADEVRFNQLHNGCEIDLSDYHGSVAPGTAGTWIQTKDADLPEKFGPGAGERQEVLRLLAKYGAFAGIVAADDGRILTGHMYAWCCQRLGIAIDVRYIDGKLEQTLKDALGKSYGRYSYAHLPKTTWAQSMAQMNRLEGESASKSTLYERIVIPNVIKSMRILDFGCGKGAYVKKLSADGYQIRGIEFYRKKNFSIDVRQVHKDIDDLLADLKHNGRFDAVVCDSVLNSVDTLAAEAAVMRCVNAFCKPEGLIFVSGRPLEDQLKQANRQSVLDRRRYVEFLDEDGFTAIYRHGEWHYQKFHDRRQVEAIAKKYIGDFDLTSSGKATKPKAELTGTSWQVWGRKSAELPIQEIENALAYEFDLPIPSGRYGRAADAISAFRSLQMLK